MVARIGKKVGAHFLGAILFTKLSRASIKNSTTFCSPVGRSLRVLPVIKAPTIRTTDRMIEVNRALVTGPRPIGSAAT